jgi:hypothetical protein
MVNLTGGDLWILEKLVQERVGDVSCVIGARAKVQINGRNLDPGMRYGIGPVWVCRVFDTGFLEDCLVQ